MIGSHQMTDPLELTVLCCRPAVHAGVQVSAAAAVSRLPGRDGAECSQVSSLTNRRQLSETIV